MSQLTGFDALERKAIHEILRALQVSEGTVIGGGRSEVPVLVIVGVSGGLDSCVLLRGLIEIRQRNLLPSCLTIVGVHIDHGLRLSSRSDADFVRGLCQGYAIPCEVKRLTPPATRENIEEWGRRERYSFYREVCEKYHSDVNGDVGGNVGGRVGCRVVIATAHHANDKLESFLFSMLTGRLASDSRVIAENCQSRNVIRPLLHLWRHEIFKLAKHWQLASVTDESNLDVNFTRNLLRLDLIPYLCTKLKLDIGRTLLKVASRLEDDDNYLWEEAARLLDGMYRNSGYGADKGRLASISLREVSHLPAAQRWRVIKLDAINKLGDVAKTISYTAACRMLARATVMASRVRRFEFGAGVYATVNGKGELSWEWDGE